MAWRRPTRSVAHAIGVSISTEDQTMTKTRTNDAADSGTIGPGDTARRAAVARAQAELIEMLARFVLAAVETGAVATPSERRRVANVQRPRQSRAGTA